MLSLGYSNSLQRSASTAASKGISNIFKTQPLSFTFGPINTSFNLPPPTDYLSNVQTPRNKPAPSTTKNSPYLHTYRTNVLTVEHGNGNLQRAPRLYSIYPSSTNDALIYETSVPSNPSSESATPSARSSPTMSEALSVDDISSTMASSSTETLQSTLPLPTMPRTVQPPNSFCPPSVRIPDDRNPSHDPLFLQTIQSHRQPNSSKLSVQLDINNASCNSQATGRVSLPNPDLASRVSSRIDRRDSMSRPPVLEASRKVTVEDCASSPSSSVIGEPILAGPPLSRPLPSIPEPSQDRHGGPDSSKVLNDRDFAGDDDDRANARDPIGFSYKSSEARPRTRAMSSNSLPLLQKVELPRRSVRWKEELVCPSPLPRRKGWFNRRGDQLWTNDGYYKPAEPGTEFPDELTNYPEPNSGWMNEIGVRIDMQHRLVPKLPTRSAMKQ